MSTKEPYQEDGHERLYILRAAAYGDTPVKHWTALVSERHRFGDMFDSGPADKSRISFRPHSVTSARGDIRGRWSPIVRLMDRHKTMRYMPAVDMERIAAKDAEITELLAAVERLREERAEIVNSSWRRGEKIAIEDLEDRARASEGSS